MKKPKNVKMKSFYLYIDHPENGYLCFTEWVFMKLGRLMIDGRKVTK